MKKLIFGFLFLAFALIVSAQNATVDKTLNYDQTYLYYTGGAADTIGVGDSTWTYTVWKWNDEPGNVYIYADIDSVSLSAGEVNCIIKGKVLPEEAYTNIDTATYAISADTTFVFDLTGVQYDYQYWQFSIESPNDENSVEVQKLDWKFLK